MTSTRLWSGVVIALLTAVSFWWFPGHTILQSDTQIYIPILKHLENPAVLVNDAMAVRPHVGFTIYDEVALFVHRATGITFQAILQTQQLICRALAVTGLCLIARAAGLNPALSLTVAALVSLGATVNGPQVLTVEYEPVPRGFALSLAVFSIGLLVTDRFRWAALTSALAFAYHPPTAAPVFTIVAVLAGRRELPVLAIGPLLVAASALTQSPVSEHVSVFSRIDPDLEAIQRMRASYNWVDTWIGRYALHYAVLFAAALTGTYRIKHAKLRFILIALPLIGVLSIAVSWLVIDYAKLLIGAEYQPARYVLYIPFCAALSCGIAGLLAAKQQRWLEAAGFLLIPCIIPLETNLLETTAMHILLCVLVALGVSLVRPDAFRLAPALLAFALYPTVGKIVNYPHMRKPDLDELSTWASGNTPQDAVFQFADIRRGADPGVFRVRAERAIFADWKAGGQANFLPDFARVWADRWKRVERPQPVSVYRDLNIDYVVFSAPKVPKGSAPVWSNRSWAVVSTNAVSGRDRIN